MWHWSDWTNFTRGPACTLTDRNKGRPRLVREPRQRGVVRTWQVGCDQRPSLGAVLADEGRDGIVLVLGPCALYGGLLCALARLLLVQAGGGGDGVILLVLVAKRTGDEGSG